MLGGGLGLPGRGAGAGGPRGRHDAARRARAAGAQQRAARRLRRLGGVRGLPRGDLRGLAALAHAPHDARPRRTPRSSAPFDGRSLRLGDDVATLEQHEGRRFIGLSRAGARSLFRVTKVIGGRYREDFVGEQVALGGAARQGAGRAARAAAVVSALRRHAALQGLLGDGARAARAGAGAGLAARVHLVSQHRAAIRGAVRRAVWRQSAPSYQGSASNELPADKAFKYVIDDAQGLRRRAARPSCTCWGRAARLPENPRHALADRDFEHARALRRSGAGRAGRRLRELPWRSARARGGAAARASRALRVQSPFMHVETAAGGAPTPAQDVNRGCAKCHTVLFSQYPFTWEGGERRHEPGRQHDQLGRGARLSARWLRQRA